MSMTDTDIKMPDELDPRRPSNGRTWALWIVIVLVIGGMLAAVFVRPAGAAQSAPHAECDRLRDAVTRYDVNVNVAVSREDVAHWNEIIRASRALRKAAGCRVP